MRVRSRGGLPGWRLRQRLKQLAPRSDGDIELLGQGQRARARVEGQGQGQGAGSGPRGRVEGQSQGQGSGSGSRVSEPMEMSSTL